MILPELCFIPVGSTVAVQHVDGGPWTHDTTVGKGDLNHNSKSYTIHITKTGQPDHQEQQTHEASIDQS